MKSQQNNQKLEQKQLLVLKRSIEGQKLNFNLTDYNYKGQEGAQKFSKLLKEVSFITNLSLQIDYNNQYGPKGLHFLAEGICSVKNLTHLFLKIGDKNMILEQGAKEIGGILLNFNNLQEFKLEIYSQNQIQDEGLQYISEGLRNLSQLLSFKLYLSGDNKITEMGCTKLAQALINLQNLEELEILIDKNNDIRVKGAEILGFSVSQLNKLKSLIFDIGYVNIHKEQLIQSFLKKVSQETLQMFNINEMNQNTYQSLQKLKINVDNPVSQEQTNTIERIREQIQKNNFILQNKIMNDEYFYHFKNLQVLNLTIKSAVEDIPLLLHLNLSLQHFIQLRELYVKFKVELDLSYIVYCTQLNEQNLIEELFKDFCNSIKYLQQLEILNIEFFANKPVSQMLIIQSLSENLIQIKTLKQICFKLDLSNFNTSEQYPLTLIQSLLNSPNIYSIYIHLSMIYASINSLEQIQNIVEAFQKLKKLNYLNLNDMKLQNKYFNLLLTKLAKTKRLVVLK